MPVHTYNAAMTCGGCIGAITRILTKQLQEGEKFDVSKIAIRALIEGGMNFWIQVNLEAKTVKVETSRDAEEIRAIIAKCGKETTFVSTADGSI